MLYRNLLKMWIIGQEELMQSSHCARNKFSMCFGMVPLLLMTTAVLTFHDLNDKSPEEIVRTYQGKEVEITGFPYKTADGVWILADDPQLKSCCVGSDKKKKSQIVLDGEKGAYPSHQVLTLLGELNFSDGRWRLTNYSHKHEGSSFGWLIAGAFIFIFGGISLKRMKP